jgi:hypothetical protein
MGAFRHRQRRVMQRPIVLVLLVFAVAPAVSACGGASSASPSDVGKRFIRDLGTGTGKDACRLMSRRLRTHFDKVFGDTCADVWKATYAQLGAKRQQYYRTVTWNPTPTINGDRATLRAPIGSMVLIKQDGRWLVNHGGTR